MGAQLITGGAGFIATALIRRLLAEGGEVLALDNFSRGRWEFAAEFEGHPRFRLEAVDCADFPALRAATEAFHRDHWVSDVWHLAANSDIAAGGRDPDVDLRDTFLSTFNVLKTMKALGISRLHFASTSAVYGDHGAAAVDEDAGPLQPISNYGAMKLASEAQISAAVEHFLPRADILRFPNVVGTPATHGVILDFLAKLAATPGRLEVLGDGAQKKPYLHVEDLVSAMLFVAAEPGIGRRVYNIGPEDDGVTVRFIAETVRDLASPGAEIVYGRQDRGWVGDVPRFAYSVARLKSRGWTPPASSAEAVARAAREIVAQEAAPCRP
jgi:UDP-glucose 4-epimerase